MSERELLQHYKSQQIKARNYLQRYIDELKFHLGLEDKHIIKIFELQLKELKSKNRNFGLFKLFQKDKNNIV